ncbi:Sad1-interacting factor 3 [Cytospora mali]|uniref:Sad1-interacting factor 3 n=1 Tax=Cytospora mali TaxID=578113 RepID=A0A194W2L9_CYTMA|nr:Sad1-interacting factor 3 [Valsa mali]
MAPQRPMVQRQDTGAGVSQGQRPPMGMQYISVDNVLRHSTEIPSGQPRMNPTSPRQQPGTIATVRAAARAAARRAGVPANSIGASSATGLPPGSRIAVPQNIPQRTTKVSEKLVLIPIPDAPDDDSPEDDDVDSMSTREDERARRIAIMQQEDDGPLRDEELDVLKKRGGIRGKSYAERLPKRQRAEKVSRLTAYCTAQGFKMKATAEFLRTKHEAKTKLYDDCLYVVYHLPLMTGTEGYRVRSRPILKTPGTGKTVLDLEIERSERRDEHYGWAAEDFSGSPGGSLDSPTNLHPVNSNGSDERGSDFTQDGGSEHSEVSLSPINRLAPDAKNFAEMFVFSYGVVVFWNFTEHQEKDILGDLTFAESEKGISLATRPFEPGDYETEEFHFEYSADIKHPRIFNDMITLLPRSDHMVKLTISHAVAQSTKLCNFEERMSDTMKYAEPVPKRLAMTGELSLGRTEIVKLLGRLFKSRVDINLSSNILPVPNFFWESEPTLHPLYMAIRDYLEIDPRIVVLNERCRVFLDLAEILSDTVADAKMSAITWIVIVLIVISICVTVSEVGLRFAILQKSSGRGNEDGNNETAHSRGVLDVYRPGSVEWKLARANITLDEFRDWIAVNEKEKGVACGSEIVGRTFAGV